MHLIIHSVTKKYKKKNYVGDNLHTSPNKFKQVIYVKSIKLKGYPSLNFNIII